MPEGAIKVKDEAVERGRHGQRQGFGEAKMIAVWQTAFPWAGFCGVLLVQILRVGRGQLHQKLADVGGHGFEKRLAFFGT